MSLEAVEEWEQRRDARLLAEKCERLELALGPATCDELLLMQQLAARDEEE